MSAETNTSNPLCPDCHTPIDDLGFCPECLVRVDNPDEDEEEKHETLQNHES